MIEFLTGDLKSLWSQASSPSCCWGPGGGNMMRDVMFDGLSDAAGLNESWELGKDGFGCVTWLPGEQCWTKGDLL